MVKNFVAYFPHNNINKIIQAMEEKAEKQREKEKHAALTKKFTMFEGSLLDMTRDSDLERSFSKA